MSMRVLAVMLPLALLAGCMGSDVPLQGYVDGTYVYVSAEAGGRVVERAATAGTRVKAGDVLFALDDADQKQQVAGADARLRRRRRSLPTCRPGSGRRRSQCWPPIFRRRGRR